MMGDQIIRRLESLPGGWGKLGPNISCHFYTIGCVMKIIPVLVTHNLV